MEISAVTRDKCFERSDTGASFSESLPGDIGPYWIQIVQAADNANRDITFEETTEAVLAHDQRRGDENSSKA